MNDRPRIVLTPWIKGQPLSYKCSECSYNFIFPEDRTPREGMAEIWAAFNEHVREEHSDADKRASVFQA